MLQNGLGVDAAAITRTSMPLTSPMQSSRMDMHAARHSSEVFPGENREREGHDDDSALTIVS